MFGPYSFEKQGGVLKGLRLVITDHTLPGEAMNGAIAWLKTLGLNILTMSPQDHDRMLAADRVPFEKPFILHAQRFIAQRSR